MLATESKTQVHRVSSAEDLAVHLDNSKIVTLSDTDGSSWTFSIRGIPALAWAPDGDLFRKLRDGNADDAMADLGRIVAGPSVEIQRSILLKGVASPSISEDGRPGTVSVDRLMARDALAIGLYAEIAKLSFDGILKFQAAKADGKAAT